PSSGGPNPILELFDGDQISNRCDADHLRDGLHWGSAGSGGLLCISLVSRAAFDRYHACADRQSIWFLRRVDVFGGPRWDRFRGDWRSSRASATEPDRYVARGLNSPRCKQYLQFSVPSG